MAQAPEPPAGLSLPKQLVAVLDRRDPVQALGRGHVPHLALLAPAAGRRWSAAPRRRQFLAIGIVDQCPALGPPGAERRAKEFSTEETGGGKATRAPRYLLWYPHRGPAREARNISTRVAVGIGRSAHGLRADILPRFPSVGWSAESGARHGAPSCRERMASASGNRLGGGLSDRP